MQNNKILSSLAWLPAVLVALLFAGCESEAPVLRPSPNSPSRRWVGPLVSVPGGGQFRTVIYYGPWQCSSELMNYCRRKCAGTGHTLQGCMWLSDINFDFDGRLMQAGSRFPMTNCCCNYGTISPSATEAARKQWKGWKDTFREDFAKRFGQWPAAPDGTPYQGHHVHDLWHGGNPTDWNNIIPYPKDLHQDLFGLYNQCYAGNSPWNTPGVDHPYVK